jgi:hypothetical protein
MHMFHYHRFSLRVSDIIPKFHTVVNFVIINVHKMFHTKSVYIRAIREVTSSELLTKQVLRKKIII